MRGEEKGCLDLWLGSDFPGSSSALSASLRFKNFQVYLASLSLSRFPTFLCHATCKHRAIRRL